MSGLMRLYLEAGRAHAHLSGLVAGLEMKQKLDKKAAEKNLYHLSNAELIQLVLDLRSQIDKMQRDADKVYGVDYD